MEIEIISWLLGIIAWILVGLVAGMLGKLIMPADDPGGFLLTSVIGMLGALMGGLVVTLLGGIGITGLNVFWSILMATVGAVIFLALYWLLASPRRA